MDLYAIIVAFFVLIFGIFIHLIYKHIFKRGKYKGITLIESAVIFIGTIPGLAGCVSGWTGFGVPLPLIVGLPLHLVFIANEDCGWTQSLVFSDRYLTIKYFYFPIAWILANLFFIGILYFFKIFRTYKSVNKKIH